MNTKSRYPEHILHKLRMRKGLDETDTHLDHVLQLMPAEKALYERVAWDLGDGSWAETIITWARDCGYKIEEPIS